MNRPSFQELESMSDDRLEEIDGIVWQLSKDIDAIQEYRKRRSGVRP